MYVSPSVQKVLGFEPQEIVGQKFAELLDPTSPLNSDVASCLQKRFLENDTSSHQHLRVFATQQRQHKILQIQTYGVRDQHGTLSVIHGLTQDVTNLFFAEQELHKRLVALEKFSLKISDREQQVLTAIKQGKLNKVIAKELQVSERSIEKIRSRLMEKFDAKTISEVVSKSTELEILKDVILLGSGSESNFNVVVTTV